MKTANSADGYLLLHKNSGCTSFDALRDVKRALGTGKIGHTGTLDKFAEGLLVVLVGKYTSLVPLFSDLDKVYTGLVRFGKETDTLDPEGNILREGPLPSFETLQSVIPGFLGNQLQEPPAYSAIHIGGRRASELSRSGKSVVMPQRPVTIYSLDVLRYDGERALIRVHCSKGTYIRSLARDIGRACGTYAFLEELYRESVGPFQDRDALRIGDGSEAADIRAALTPVRTELFNSLGIPVVALSEAQARYVAFGKPLEPLLTEVQSTKKVDGRNLIALCTKEGEPCALIERNMKGFQPGWKYRQVLV
ncbi:MAG: tRNA pseudouridine(55) synthase TruB [Termitinemataceae bacterium]